MYIYFFCVMFVTASLIFFIYRKSLERISIVYQLTDDWNKLIYDRKNFILNELMNKVYSDFNELKTTNCEETRKIREELLEYNGYALIPSFNELMKLKYFWIKSIYNFPQIKEFEEWVDEMLEKIENVKSTPFLKEN